MTEPTAPATTRRPLTAATFLAFDLDVLLVIVFAAVGRRTHEHGLDIGGILGTAWPFLVGLVVGWLVMRAHRRPLAPWSTGVGVWLATWGVGMALRALTEAGTAPAFMLVALGFLALALVGWRVVGTLVARIRG